jgi:uncharacterized protein (TIGR02996 family)
VNQADALLQAVCENPEDDAPRLVYADWLDERPDNESRLRAEFIRVQCALAHGAGRGDPAATGPATSALRRREQELMAALSAAWSLDILTLVADNPSTLHGSWEYRRGFVEAVVVRIDRFPGIAERLFRVAPVLDVLFTSPPGGRRTPAGRSSPAHTWDGWPASTSAGARSATAGWRRCWPRRTPGASPGWSSGTAPSATRRPGCWRGRPCWADSTPSTCGRTHSAGQGWRR